MKKAVLKKLSIDDITQKGQKLTFLEFKLRLYPRMAQVERSAGGLTSLLLIFW